MRILVLALLTLYNIDAGAQNIGRVESSAQPALKVKDLEKLAKSYRFLSASLQQQSLHYLTRLQKEESRVQLIQQSKNGTPGHVSLTETPLDLEQLRKQLVSPVNFTLKNPLREYFPRLDSLKTALLFLQLPIQGGLISGQLEQIQGLQKEISIFETSMQQATNINYFIQQRQEQWKASLEKAGKIKQLTTLKKEFYYYQQQINEYRDILQNKDKLTTKIVSKVSDLPAFGQFMKRNSYLSTLFRMPGGSDSENAENIPGLQTHAQVDSLIGVKMGCGASLPAAVMGDENKEANNNPLAGNMQEAQNLLNTWKTKFSQYGTGNSQTTLPDFKPNTQHNKAFWHRLVTGFNLQSTSGTTLLPAYSDLALSLGYKIKGNSVAGISGSYKMGWGQPFNHLALSSEGVGIRSFIDWDLGKNIFVSGGYEWNYLQAFSQLRALRNIQAWQPSGLLGLTKKMKIGRRQQSIQLLYDMLHTTHLPQSQPLIFRVGYSFN
ncbi:hypothetical protein ACX0G9_05190 [Flavitalea flava]